MSTGLGHGGWAQSTKMSRRERIRSLSQSSQGPQCLLRESAIFYAIGPSRQVCVKSARPLANARSVASPLKNHARHVGQISENATSRNLISKYGLAPALAALGVVLGLHSASGTRL
jgi:hypothetical protein